jgi:hypothetical protein
VGQGRRGTLPGLLAKHTTSHERIVMTLPVAAESVDPAACDAAIVSLRQLLGVRLSSAAQVREQHGKDASYHPYVAPDAVAFAQSSVCPICSFISDLI